MGDRANVFVADADVYLYSHWGGWNLAEVVRDALRRGRGRWTDSSYLARIVFCEMVKGNEMEETGYGISAQLTDNERPIIVLNPRDQTISVTADGWRADVSQNLQRKMPFAQFIELSAEQVREWHLDKTDE